MNTKTALAAIIAAVLLSNCTYRTYIVEVPKPPTTTKPKTVSRPTTSHTSPDDFQVITKPTSYSR